MEVTENLLFSWRECTTFELTRHRQEIPFRGRTWNRIPFRVTSVSHPTPRKMLRNQEDLRCPAPEKWLFLLSYFAWDLRRVCNAFSTCERWHFAVILLSYFGVQEAALQQAERGKVLGKWLTHASLVAALDLNYLLPAMSCRHLWAIGDAASVAQ